MERVVRVFRNFSFPFRKSIEINNVELQKNKYVSANGVSSLSAKLFETWKSDWCSKLRKHLRKD